MKDKLIENIDRLIFKYQERIAVLKKSNRYYNGSAIAETEVETLETVVEDLQNLATDKSLKEG